MPKPKNAAKPMYSLQRRQGREKPEGPAKAEISATLVVRTSKLVQLIAGECRKAGRPDPGKEGILAILRSAKEPELAQAVEGFLTNDVDREHEMTVERLRALSERIKA
jgi:hypothetical protein